MRNILLGCHKKHKLIFLWVWTYLGFLYLFRHKFLKTRERLCLSAVLKFEAFMAVRPVPNLASKSSASVFLFLFSPITPGDIALSQKKIFDFSIHQLKERYKFFVDNKITCKKLNRNSVCTWSATRGGDIACEAWQDNWAFWLASSVADCFCGSNPARPFL